MLRIPLLIAALLAGAPAWAADKLPILVFTSDDDPAAKALVSAFATGADFGVRMTYDLGAVDDPRGFIEENLADVQPGLVFAIGGLALREAARAWPDAPVVYADVSEDTARRIAHRRLIAVGARPDPAAVARRVGAALPYARRYAVVARPDDTAYLERLEAAIRAEGGALRRVPARGPDEVRAAARRAVFGADALLVLDDPALWTPAALDAAFGAAAERRVPAIGFDARQLAAALRPALTVEVDADATAAEAIRIAREVLVDGRPDPTPGAPEPRVTADKGALAAARVPLSRRAADAIDAWTDPEAR